ncbi:hypothetical protein B0I35DRAFT_365852 [Stachybotrys elegans]|uniref:PD-(D/E)XK nuclease-like domain-containing protein n=1 Tax=Stachybotrys elegans TaxID=80388 RepID=A0A8K0SCS6_9HYPO|nr:hypothetical protein B0I35DRAFT_365852 [Stachybotrys elegans]
MLDDNQIHLWLENVPDHPDSDCAAPRKRKQLQQFTPPHSTSGTSGMEHTSTPKRRRIGDDDKTPRAKGARTGSQLSSLSSISLPPSQQGDMPTQASSPRRQFMGLNLDIGGLECKQLDSDHPPLAAARLVQKLLEIDMGIDILPHEKQSEVTRILQEKGLNSKTWRSAFKDEGADTLPGRVPSWEELNTVREQAMECFNSDHEEFSWNMEVHHPLLKSIFRASGSDSGQPFDFMSCTTARPHRNYLPYSSRQKMVDFCLFDNSDVDAQARRALAQRTITQTVNHTDYRPLQLRPIILSIETKRPGKDLDVAQLQMGVWHTAQWRFLQSAVKAMITSTQPDGADEEAITDAVKAALLQLGLLPGVIIQGHRWLFVFSTLEPHTTILEDGTDITVYRTILWTEQEFGSTQSILKTYQIVAGLRHLAGWVKDFYTPWYRKYVLSSLGPKQST